MYLRSVDSIAASSLGVARDSTDLPSLSIELAPGMLLVRLLSAR